MELPRCQETFLIPDLLVNWPYKRILSNHCAQAREESDLWVESLGVFDQKGRKDYLACDVSLLATLTYSSRDEKEFIRLGCDLMNVFFIIDEYTDIADREITTKVTNSICKYLDSQEPMSIQPHDVMEKMSQEFWDRALKLASPGDNCFQSFATTMTEYLQAVIEEAEERNNGGTIQTIADYLVARRGTSGSKPTLSLFEFGLDLQKDVLQHPVISELTRDAVEMICLVNDMHSFPREYSRERNCHNILTYIMLEKKVDLITALGWLEMYAHAVTERFVSNLKRVPSWDEVTDTKVKIYIDGIGQWVRGCDDWSFEGRRYYRGKGINVRETRKVTLKNSEQGFFINELQLKQSLGVAEVAVAA
ncbi:isoprenoid synthase domain-containing protein [Cyathus striatus]|nr:isoprenoid synthase domain-containing protein [Cyathus striatus]